MNPPSNGMLSLPSRSAASLTPTQMQTLAHAHKQVFALSDGTKTVNDIARLLTKSLQDVQQILHDLQAMHLIKF